MESSFNFDFKNEIFNNTFANNQTFRNINYSNNIIPSEKKLLKKSANKSLIEESREYEESENSQEENFKPFIELDENMFSNAINFSHFNNEFLTINFNKHSSNNNNNILNQIEENYFEENYNKENHENLDNLSIKSNKDKQYKEAEKNINDENLGLKTKIFPKNENSQLNNNSSTSVALNKNNTQDYLSLNNLKNLSIKLDKDDYVQKELNLLNENYIRNENRKNKKGLKYDRELYLNLNKKYTDFLSEDQSNQIIIDDERSQSNLINEKIHNEEVK